MNIELHGPAWAWILIAAWVAFVYGFAGGFIRAALDDWRSHHSEKRSHTR